MNLALFDFDGTITHVPTYTPFVRQAIRRPRQVWGGAVLSPLIAGYRCGVVSDYRIRQAVSRVGFMGDDPARVRREGERFAADVLPGFVRPIARERIAWHKAQGDRIVVVSASLDAYLLPWCRALDLEVICTELEVRQGRLTGRYVDGDCCGEEKPRRIRTRYRLDDYDTIYAYGDTDDDRPMLALASRRFLCWSEI
jgi:HAD superfamily hydrolase (TIGR01490 family)